MDIVIRRSKKRRTVALRVTAGGVTLYAPHGVPKEDLLRWAGEKRAWIEKARSKFAARLSPAHRLEDGEILPFLGEALTLRLAPRGDVARLGNVLEVPNLPPPQLREVIEDWYRDQALAFFTPLAREMAARLGTAPSAVKLTEARARWGSCTAQGTLRFNWRVLLGSREVAGYLCAHEVAHLRELNHSPGFWRLVAELMSHFAAAREELRREGWRFSLGDSSTS